MFDELKEWILLHIKNRDLLQNLITGFEDVPGFDLVVRRSDADQFFLVRPEISDAEEIVSKAIGNRLGVVTLNKKSNVDFVVKHWDSFKDVDKLCFYFVNPRTGDKWMLFPKTHELITEKAALKPGLMSLYTSIPTYD